MSVVSRVPEAVMPRAEVMHRSIQTASGKQVGAAVDWRRRHARALLVGDLIVLALAVGTAQVVRFGVSPDRPVSGLGASYAVLGVALAATWWLSLQMHQAR